MKLKKENSVLLFKHSNINTNVTARTFGKSEFNVVAQYTIFIFCTQFIYTHLKNLLYGIIENSKTLVSLIRGKPKKTFFSEKIQKGEGGLPLMTMRLFRQIA